MNTEATDELQIKALIDRWAQAVREEDRSGIRADHDPDILMFDVPPPFTSRGIEAYMATWDTFYAYQVRPIQFDFRDIEVTCDGAVAFATALGHCLNIDRSGQPEPLDFRLTMGLKKVDGRWRIMHEHHSLPAE